MMSKLLMWMTIPLSIAVANSSSRLTDAQIEKVLITINDGEISEGKLEQALDTIEKELIPNSKNGELTTFLQKTRTAVAEHLDQAKEVQGKL